MTTTVQAVHFSADKKLVAFVNEKTAKLTALHENITACDVILKLDKASDNLNKIAEIKIKLKGTELFSKKQCSTFEEAVDLCVDALKTQLKKYKEKRVLEKY